MKTLNEMNEYAKQLIECANRNNIDLNDIVNVANILYKEQLEFNKIANSESGEEIIKFLSSK